MTHSAWNPLYIAPYLNHLENHNVTYSLQRSYTNANSVCVEDRMIYMLLSSISAKISFSIVSNETQSSEAFFHGF